MRKRGLVLLAFFAFLAAIGFHQTADAQGSLEGVSISVLASANPDTVAFRDIVCKAFEKETGAKIKVDLFPYVDVFKKEVLSFSGKQHDVYWVDQMWLRKFQKSGYLEPLEPHIQKHKLDFKMFYPNLVNIVTIDGHIYALPAVSKPVIYGYRKDVFSEMGLAVPETWDGALKIAQKLTDFEKKRYGFVLRAERGNPICWTWMPILRTFGGDIFDKDMKPIFNSKDAIASVEFLKELYKCSLPGGLSTDDVANALASGNGMTTTIMSTIFPALDDPKASKVVGKLDYADMPKGPSGKRSTMIGFAPYAIAKSSPDKVKDAAFQLFKFFVSDTIQKKLMYETAWYPAIPSLYELPNLHRSKKISGLVQSYGEPPPLIPEAEEWFLITGTALQDVLFKDKPAKQAMDEAVAKTYEMMKEAGYYK